MAVGYMALGATEGRWDVLATWLRTVGRRGARRTVRPGS